MDTELNSLIQDFDNMLTHFPEKRREFVRNVGEKMEQEVLRNIDRDTKSKTGKLRRAVSLKLGSGGGYAAVRNSNRVAPHAYLVENGHAIVDKNGRRVGWVAGKHMYRNALNTMTEEIEHDAQRMMDEMVGGIFGN